MITAPDEGSGYYRVVGVDPGGDTIGFAVLTYHVETRLTALEFAKTLMAKKELRYYQHLQDVHEDRFIRQIIIQDFFQSILSYYRPQAVVSEAPFLGRFPQAFLSLTECLQILRLSVFDYDPTLHFESVDPPSVKLAVGAPAKSKDKTLVAEGVKRLPFNNLTGLSLDQFDEHTTDAIAVAWWRLSKILP